MTTSEAPAQEAQPEKKPWLSQNALALLLIANLVVSVLALAKSREASQNAYMAAQNATRAARAADLAAFEAERASSSIRQLPFQRW